jgi:WD40 repeat protein
MTHVTVATVASNSRHCDCSGDRLHSLEGHKNVVYAIAFNNPFGDKIVSGSFDRTAKASAFLGGAVAAGLYGFGT